MLESNIVNGSTRITNLGLTLTRNLKIISNSKSLPANSEIYNQTDWSKKISIKIQKVLANVFKYDLNMYKSSIFNDFNLIYSYSSLHIYLFEKQISFRLMED